MRCRCSTALSAAAAGTFFFRRSQKQPEPETVEEKVSFESYSPLKLMIQKTWPRFQEHKEYRESFIRLAKCDSPDAILVRFLASCNNDSHEASQKLINTLQWRVDTGVERIVERGELYAKETNDDQFLEQLRTGKVTMLGRDLSDRPICYIQVHLHQPSKLTQNSLREMTVWVMETMRLFLRPQKTLKDSMDSPQNVNVLFDLSNFSLHNMDYSFVKYLASCLEYYYPQSLGVCILHKSPWIFRSVWNIIKGWIKPEIAAKIVFTQSANDLEKYIDYSVIPTSLGGGNKKIFQYIEPVEHENDAVIEDSAEKTAALARYYAYFSEWEQHSLNWAKLDDDDAQNEKVRLCCDAAGTNFANCYWNVDKYIRARTVYDRLKWIGNV